MKRSYIELSILTIGLLLMSSLVPAMDAQKIAEIRSNGNEDVWQFIRRLPGSFEAQLLYGLVGSGLIGMLGSWLWKWSKGEADGFAHFTPRYLIGQVLWLLGSSTAAIMTVGFSTESGEFFGWLSVLWAGGFTGFSGEVKQKGEQVK